MSDQPETETGIMYRKI